MKAARMDLTLPGEHRKPRLGTEARAGRVLGVLLFTVVFLTSGTRGHWFVSVGQTFSDARPASSDSSLLREIITSGRLTDLRWPDFSDYRDHRSEERRVGKVVIVSDDRDTVSTAC